MNLIDKNFVKVQFNKGLESYANEASVQEYMAQKLMDELCVACDRPFGHIFEVGSGTGFLTYRIIEKLQFDNLTVNDIAKTSKQKVQELEKVYKMTIPFIEAMPRMLIFHISWMQLSQDLRYSGLKIFLLFLTKWLIAFSQMVYWLLVLSVAIIIKK